MVIIKFKTEGHSRNRKSHHKTQSKILPLPWLSESGTEQLGQEATLLSWPKSIYHQWLIPLKPAEREKKCRLFFTQQDILDILKKQFVLALFQFKIDHALLSS